MTPGEITLPVYVRVGEIGGHWGSITFTPEDGPVTEDKIRAQTAAFFREAAARLETPDAYKDEEEPTCASAPRSFP
ncbi:hypothetical protein [Streptomyces acidiscabies]|uniref:hypothetical protein n=1 Tax=Streptomyces acidiscabies TaxID=42234 RepID=UPI00073E5316|nr:hypothetical protein [Streptomyces acidiscabies]GAQ52073.1 hypothetical protein a10_01854 [Streptomyces acidiscabies]